MPWSSDVVCIGARDAAAGKQVLDLADRDDRLPGAVDEIEQRRLRRLEREISPIGRSRERRRARPRTAARSRAPRPGRARSMSNASWQMRYCSSTGMTSSCAAIWNTLSADV